MLHLVKKVIILYGVLSEISPFVLMFDKKQQNKDDVPRIKKVTFCGIYWVFAQFLSKISTLRFQFLCKISTFVLFFHEKHPEIEDVPHIDLAFCENCHCIILGFCSISV